MTYRDKTNKQLHAEALIELEQDLEMLLELEQEATLPQTKLGFRNLIKIVDSWITTLKEETQYDSN